ncbi:hypothetical protein J1N35_045358 [Gossypium stocksii]|uniref:Uncharacterized protein n=1 Tax=Gossypium stocksii TaxID=47602 RepID=A0A9D3ZGF3_9ROSI|nr:hypothetical protein J1N35_045358 [Gossypium stocksii]
MATPSISGNAYQENENANQNDKETNPISGNGVSSMANHIPHNNNGKEESNPSMDENDDNNDGLTLFERDLVMIVVVGDLPFIPHSSPPSDNHTLAIFMYTSNHFTNPFSIPVLNFGPFTPNIEVDDSIIAKSLISYPFHQGQ